MRFLNAKEAGMVGAFALGAAVVLLVRLANKVRRRKEERDTAVATLRESGEFFLPSLDADPAWVGSS